MKFIYTFFPVGECYICDGEEVLHFHRLSYDLDQGADAACNGDDTQTTVTEETVYYRA